MVDPAGTVVVVDGGGGTAPTVTVMVPPLPSGELAIGVWEMTRPLRRSPRGTTWVRTVTSRPRSDAIDVADARVKPTRSGTSTGPGAAAITTATGKPLGASAPGWRVGRQDRGRLRVGGHSARHTPDLQLRPAQRDEPVPRRLADDLGNGPRLGPLGQQHPHLAADDRTCSDRRDRSDDVALGHLLVEDLLDHTGQPERAEQPHGLGRADAVEVGHPHAGRSVADGEHHLLADLEAGTRDGILVDDHVDGRHLVGLVGHIHDQAQAFQLRLGVGQRSTGDTRHHDLGHQTTVVGIRGHHPGEADQGDEHDDRQPGDAERRGQRMRRTVDDLRRADLGDPLTRRRQVEPVGRLGDLARVGRVGDLGPVGRVHRCGPQQVGHPGASVVVVVEVDRGAVVVVDLGGGGGGSSRPTTMVTVWPGR